MKTTSQFCDGIAADVKHGPTTVESLENPSSWGHWKLSEEKHLLGPQGFPALLGGWRWRTDTSTVAPGPGSPLLWLQPSPQYVVTELKYHEEREWS